MMATRTLVALAGLGFHVVRGQVKKFDCVTGQHTYEISVSPNEYTLNQVEFEPVRRTLIGSALLGDLTEIDACGMSPKDDKMYCIVKQKNKNNNLDFDLVRVDPQDLHIAYVAAVLHDVPDNADTPGFYSGGFDSAGNYIASNTNGPTAGMYSIYRPDVLNEYATQTDSRSLVKRSDNTLGHDLVVLNNNIYSFDAAIAGPPELAMVPVSDAVSSHSNIAPIKLTRSQASETLPDTAENYKAMYTHEGVMYVQHKTEGTFKIEIDEDKLEYTATKLIDVGSTDATDGASCHYEHCACPNNAIATQKWCPASDLTLHCPNKCLCPNGVVDPSCRATGSISCSSCNTGYHLKANQCAANSCTCSNGVGQTGVSCSAHGSEECLSCNPGYRLAGEICVKKHKPLPKPKPKPTCFCNNGIAHSHCADPAEESCKQCFEGYILKGNTCVVVGDLGSMPPNPNSAPAAVGSALGGLGFNYPRLFDAESGPAISTQSGKQAFAVAGSIVAVAALAIAAVRRRGGGIDDAAQANLVETGSGYALTE